MTKLFKTLYSTAAGIALSLAVSGSANASITPMSADELAKEFAKGSLACEWTSADGTTMGKDFYYKNQTAWSGDADRDLGDSTKHGSWKILGQGFWTKFDESQKAPGTWMNLEKVGEKTYKAYDSSRQHIKTMTCK